jgi:hypothetical protein
MLIGSVPIGRKKPISAVRGEVDTADDSAATAELGVHETCSSLVEALLATGGVRN